MAGLTSKEAQVETGPFYNRSLLFLAVPGSPFWDAWGYCLGGGGGVIPGSARNGKLENGNEGCHLGWHHQKKEAFKLDAYICA